MVGTLLYLYLRPNIRHLPLTERDRLFLDNDHRIITDIFEFDDATYRICTHHYTFGYLTKKEELASVGNVDSFEIAFRLDLNYYSSEQARLFAHPSVFDPIYFDIENSSLNSFPSRGAINNNFRLSIGEQHVLAIYQLDTTIAYIPNAEFNLELEYLESFSQTEHVIFISARRIE